jgi:hypothetical protein
VLEETELIYHGIWLQEGPESNARKANSNEASGCGGRVLAACSVGLTLLVDKVVETNTKDTD